MALNLNGSRVWEISCEKCGAVIHVRGCKETAVFTLRHKYGWAIGKNCLCARCRPTPQEYHSHHEVRQ